jgi:hypothetical protein
MRRQSSYLGIESQVHQTEVVGQTYGSAEYALDVFGGFCITPRKGSIQIQAADAASRWGAHSVNP